MNKSRVYRESKWRSSARHMNPHPAERRLCRVSKDERASWFETAKAPHHPDGQHSATRAHRVLGAAVHRQYDHLGANADPRIQISDILVGEADAAGRDVSADGLRRVGAVDAIHGAAEIHGAGAKRVAGTAGHVTRQVR